MWNKYRATTVLHTSRWFLWWWGFLMGTDCIYIVNLYIIQRENCYILQFRLCICADCIYCTIGNSLFECLAERRTLFSVMCVAERLFGFMLLEFCTNLLERSNIKLSLSGVEMTPKINNATMWEIILYFFVSELLFGTQQGYVMQCFLIWCNKNVFGHFCILSPSSNAQAQFVAKGSVTTLIHTCF